MQNKPNLPNAQMNVNTVKTKDYENKPLRRRGENKAKTNPIKANTKPIKPNSNPILSAVLSIVALVKMEADGLFY